MLAAICRLRFLLQVMGKIHSSLSGELQSSCCEETSSHEKLVSQCGRLCRQTLYLNDRIDLKVGQIQAVWQSEQLTCPLLVLAPLWFLCSSCLGRPGCCVKPRCRNQQ